MSSLPSPDARPRRLQVLDVIEADGGQVTTARVIDLCEAVGLRLHRNTARKKLRVLTRQGELVCSESNGQHSYSLHTRPIPDCGA